MSEFHQQLGAYDVWAFPSLEDHVEYSIGSETNGSLPGNEIDLVEEQRMAEQQAALDEHLARLHDKTQLLDNIATDLNRKLTEIDETLLNDMIDLIKNSVRKILHRELTLDATSLQHMIEQTLAGIHGDNESCVVYVSANEYVQVAQDTRIAHMDIRCDNNLARGDFVIKTRLCEVEAILEQRLNALFGL